MFSNIYKKRMEKWENVVIETLLESFKNDDWENVYLNELTDNDIGKYIQIIPASDIFNMARRIIDNESVNTNFNSTFVLDSIKQNKKLVLSTSSHKPSPKKQTKLFTKTVSNDSDLIFIKDVPAKDEDPLKLWCKKFLKEYSHNDSVDKTIETIPTYNPTPTEKRMYTLQKKRQQELLSWGSHF